LKEDSSTDSSRQMRIAILADIHGNLAAFEAALERVAQLRVDHVIIAGDIVVGGPDSLACWERVKALGYPALRGNHERYVFDLGTERARPEWSTPQFGPVQFAATQLGEEKRQELAALPAMLCVPGVDDLLIVHASARNDSDLIFNYTSDEEIDPMFAGYSERWIVRGHNHYAGVRLWRDRRIFTSGAVGLSLDGTTKAQFLVLERRGAEWYAQHHAVAYDINKTLRRFRESGYLEQGGPIARLYMREIETAAFHLIPFQKFNADLIRAGKILPLEEAVIEFERRR
jgi:predicted phosphodiesterase